MFCQFYGATNSPVKVKQVNVIYAQSLERLFARSPDVLRAAIYEPVEYTPEY